MDQGLRSALLAAVLFSLLGIPALAQFNGGFEDAGGGNFDLTGWTWDCEDPESSEGYLTLWGVKKITPVAGVPPEPCSGVTEMQHPIPDVAGAGYVISGWAYVDDPNMSASIGFGYSDWEGSLAHHGDYTISTTWDYLYWSDDHSFFQGLTPQASLNVSDGSNGFGYGHFDGLELTITPLTTGVGTTEAPSLRVSLSPDGGQLAIWSVDAPRSVWVCDALGRAEYVERSMSSATTTPVILDVAALPAGLHVVMLYDGQEITAARFVKG